MMVSNRGSVLRLLLWQWRRVVLFTVASLVPVALHQELGMIHWALPALPVAVAGGALGIFVSFRTNSAYARWWEGRILWGGMVNVSRHFASQVIAYVQVGSDVHQRLVRRHIAYLHVLRCALRAQDPTQDDDVQRNLTEDERPWLGLTSPAHLLLDRQLRQLTELSRAGSLDAFQLRSLDGSLRDMLNFQGGMERIKKTPMPRGYGFIADRLTVAFALLLPFALVAELGWVTVPVSVLVCLAFALISEAGRVLEDPFTMFWNGLPLFAITKTIEHNLREALGERDLPPLPSANAEGILL
jgi:putative membrane protein